jgi:hypothetical protein
VMRDRIIAAFEANLYLNGAILAVLAFGILFCFWLALRLWPEVTWIKRYQQGRELPRRAPRLIAPLTVMIGEKRGRLRLNTTTMRSILDGLGTRLDENRELSRYLVGLLVFLGLLGTFWGLLETIQAVTAAINKLSVGGGEDFAKVFDRFKSDLANSLGGAGIAFSTSLFGLSGSLILGLLDLQAGQAQNRFYNDFEDWLSGMTRLSTLPTDADGDVSDSVPAYLQALLEHTAETMEDVHTTLARGESDRSQTNANLAALTHRLGTLTEQLKTEQELMLRLAEAQVEMKPVLTRLSDEQSFGRQEFIAQLRTEFNAMTQRLAEVQLEMRPTLHGIAEGHGAAHQELLRELRNEFRLLARTLAQVALGKAQDDRGRKPSERPTQKLD